ncbi:hypothetical protein A2U01_0082232 [Trifolium medium]|uniref:F-box domain-containing protein n=1 Tax=Trifolium medium TaxID=97028 RepID=A0A392TLG1_9FABA|nr:hypothetical protein [Trifolium medium]
MNHRSNSRNLGFVELELNREEMARTRKMTKLEEEKKMKTLLASVPDQILGHILSFLSMKESYKKTLISK